MAQLLQIKMLNQNKVVELRNNFIQKATIKAAFLLADDALVSLFYRRDEIQISCEMNEAGTIFFLPNEWPSMEFTVESNYVPSRPSTHADMERHLSGYHWERSELPYFLNEKLADGLRTRLFFIHRGQKALQDEKEVETSAEHMRDLVVDGGCVSPISSRAAVTYAHKSHKILREYDEGQDDEVNTHSIVEIRNVLDQRIRYEMKVIVVDHHHDFVILRSVDGREIFEDYPHSKRSPKTFEPFIGFGLSHETEDGQQITHRNGWICSDSVDHRGRFLASSSIDGEHSGGPCYSADRALIGIMVASTSTDPELRTEYDRESVEEEIIEASSHPADTWITSASLIAEAYKNYQVKHGILIARRERNRREPRAKRRAIDTSPLTILSG